MKKKHWRVNLKRLDKYVVDFATDKGDLWEIDGLNSVVVIGKGEYLEESECYNNMPSNITTHWRLHKLCSRMNASNPRSPLRFPRHLFASLFLRLYSKMQPSDKIAVDCDPSTRGRLRSMYEEMGFTFVAYGPLPCSREKESEQECLMVANVNDVKKWCLLFRQDSRVHKIIKK